jgi:kynurenine formamidase
MNAKFDFSGMQVRVDFAAPIDISLPVCGLNARAGDNPNAFFVDEPVFAALEEGGFVGAVARGGAYNCEVIMLTPHGNGTHTECIGHITRERVSIHQVLRQFHCFARLFSVEPTLAANGDHIVTAEQLQPVLADFSPHQALIVRTLPNDESKRTRRYSGANPPYLHPAAAALCAAHGVQHLLLDLPSLDKEDDGGLLAAHHAFWKVEKHTSQDFSNARWEATITELVFVPNDALDGSYLLNLQIASLETDASPSKPVLYKLRVHGE